MQKPYLEAGKIVNTHGVRGEVRIQPWADDAAFLLGFRTFYIDGAPVHVAHSRVHKGMLVAKFADYDDVNAAMTLKNRVVSIARADVTLLDGQYFQQDLIGIAVETDAGEPLGTLDIFSSDGTLLVSLPLLAGESVARVTWWQLFCRCAEAAFCIR